MEQVDYFSLSAVPGGGYCKIQLYEFVLLEGDIWPVPGLFQSNIKHLLMLYTDTSR